MSANIDRLAKIVESGKRQEWPGVTHDHAPRQADLERELRATCEGFIEQTVAVLVGPVLAFVAKLGIAPPSGEGIPKSLPNVLLTTNRRQTWLRVSSVEGGRW